MWAQLLTARCKHGLMYWGYVHLHGRREVLHRPIYFPSASLNLRQLKGQVLSKTPHFTLSLAPLNQTHLQSETWCCCIRPLQNSVVAVLELWIYFWLQISALQRDLIWRLLSISNAATVVDAFLVKHTKSTHTNCSINTAFSSPYMFPKTSHL